MISKKISAVLFASAILLMACSQETTPKASKEPQVQSPIISSVPIVEPKKQEQPQKFDGPFGLKMGLTYEELQKIIPGLIPREGETNSAISSTVPVTHNNFESYVFRFSDKSGLCRISGIGKEIKSGSNGSEIKSVFSSLDEALTSKYGNGKKYDFINSSYASQEHWMLYLLQKNSTLSKIWNKESKATLPVDIESVLIKAGATSLSEGFIIINYEFENISDCIAEDKEIESKAL